MFFLICIIELLFASCRARLVFSDPPGPEETHRGVQEGSGLHAEQRAPDDPQPGGQVPAGGPQAPLQGQCCVSGLWDAHPWKGL